MLIDRIALPVLSIVRLPRTHSSIGLIRYVRRALGYFLARGLLRSMLTMALVTTILFGGRSAPFVIIGAVAAAGVPAIIVISRARMVVLIAASGALVVRLRSLPRLMIVPSATIRLIVAVVVVAATSASRLAIFLPLLVSVLRL